MNKDKIIKELEVLRDKSLKSKDVEAVMIGTILNSIILASLKEEDFLRLCRIMIDFVRSKITKG